MRHRPAPPTRHPCDPPRPTPGLRPAPSLTQSVILISVRACVGRQVCGQENEMAIKVAINLISATISKYGNQGDQEKLEEIQKLGLEFQEIAVQMTSTSFWGRISRISQLHTT